MTALQLPRPESIWPNTRNTSYKTLGSDEIARAMFCDASLLAYPKLAMHVRAVRELARRTVCYSAEPVS